MLENIDIANDRHTARRPESVPSSPLADPQMVSASPEPPGRLVRTVAKLREIVDSEIAHLKFGRVDLLEKFAKEKMSVLGELNAAMAERPVGEVAADNRDSLREIERLLSESARALKLRMDAINEITDTIESAIHEAESDGTYEAGPVVRNGRG